MAHRQYVVRQCRRRFSPRVVVDHQICLAACSVCTGQYKFAHEDISVKFSRVVGVTTDKLTDGPEHIQDFPKDLAQ